MMRLSREKETLLAVIAYHIIMMSVGVYAGVTRMAETQTELA